MTARVTAGKTLHHARNLRGLSLLELAKIVSVEQKTLSEIENDRATMDVDLAVRLAGALQLGDARMLLPNQDRLRVYDGILHPNGVLAGASGMVYPAQGWTTGFEGRHVRILVEVIDEPTPKVTP